MVWMLALVPRSSTRWFMDISVTKACRHIYMINICHVLMSCGKVIFICVDKWLAQKQQYYAFRIWCEKKDKQPLVFHSRNTEQMLEWIYEVLWQTSLMHLSCFFFFFLEITKLTSLSHKKKKSYTSHSFATMFIITLIFVY